MNQFGNIRGVDTLLSNNRNNGILLFFLSKKERITALSFFLNRIYQNGIKAIVSSGYANDPVMADYQQYGFSGVVTKPYKFDEWHQVLTVVITKNKGFA